MTKQTGISRRDILKTGGALVVSIAAAGGLPTAARARPFVRSLSPGQIDTYIAIDEDGMVTAFFGKMDMGQGLDVGIAQIVAEELDVPLDRVDVIMGDTALTVNQGGASGSTGIERGSRPLRSAAAEARRILVQLGSETLDIPVEQLEVTDGVVHAADDPSRRATYGELIGGRHFDTPLEWNEKYGNSLDAQGVATPKSPDRYKVVGQPERRRDLTDIIMGTQEYIVDVRLPGMMHGRVVRPPVAGAVPASIDESSIEGIVGARVVQVDDWLGVVAETEWGAIRAAEDLAVEWSRPGTPPFPEQDTIFDHIRAASVTRESAGEGFSSEDVPADIAAFDAAAAGAARIVEAEYEFPFQSHASMSPACAVCDYRGDHATIYTGSQKPHYTAQGVAAILDLPEEAVRGIWRLGPGSYGRNDAGDTAMDAALLSKATGRPVRVQAMRHEGTAWDPKAPASVHLAKAALDDDGNVIGYMLRSKGFSAGNMASNESNPSDTYAGMLTGWPDASVPRFSNPEENYTFPAKVKYWQTIPPLMQMASPLRTAHMRDPMGPQNHFASESFIDELAYDLNVDPVEFRLKHLSDERDVAVVRTVAERAGWDPRRAGPRAPLPATGLVSGRGIGYTRRGNPVAAVVAFIDVDLDSGMIYPRRFVVVADQGLIINPLWVERTIQGNIVMGCSRILTEEVMFTPEMVTSNDWMSYQIIDMPQAPREVEVTLINRPDLPPYGAGEPTTRPVAPAIANALFDATGVRLRRAPLTAERVKAALESARS